MRSLIIATLTAFTALTLTAQATRAQEFCAPSLHVLLALDRLGETEHEMLTRKTPSTGQDVQWIIWLNEVTGAWTLTGTTGSTTCVFAGSTSGYSGQEIMDFLEGPTF